MFIFFVLMFGLLSVDIIKDNNLKEEEKERIQISIDKTAEKISTSVETKPELKKVEPIQEEVKLETKTLEPIKEEVKLETKIPEPIKEEVKLETKTPEPIKEEVKDTNELNTTGVDWLKLALYLLGSVLVIATGTYLYRKQSNNSLSNSSSDYAGKDFKEEIKADTTEQQLIEEEVQSDTTEQQPIEEEVQSDTTEQQPIEEEVQSDTTEQQPIEEDENNNK